MTDSTKRMEDVHEDQALFHTTYPSAYYVQSPSTLSHANSTMTTDINIRNTEESIFQSPIRSEPPNPAHEASRFTLSHYSSSRGSNHENGQTRLIIFGRDDDEDGDVGEEEEEHDYGKRAKGWWKRYLSYRNYDSVGWICLQISWRAVFSLGVALLVFCIATKPPVPAMSIKMAGVELKLGEGVDQTGVTTKILTCNCSMNLIVDNKSKLFALHILPPTLQLSFGPLPFALSHGPRMYAESGSSVFGLNVGTRNKPMYGAGRSMEDQLESGKGLRLGVRVSLSSYFRVVWKLIQPKFHHQLQCSLFITDKAHVNSSCILATS